MSDLSVTAESYSYAYYGQSKRTTELRKYAYFNICRIYTLISCGFSVCEC